VVAGLQAAPEQGGYNSGAPAGGICEMIIFGDPAIEKFLYFPQEFF